MYIDEMATSKFARVSIAAGTVCWMCLLSGFIVLLLWSYSLISIAGICFLIGIVLGPVSVVSGVKAVKELNRTRGVQGGKDLAIAGIIAGGTSLEQLAKQ